MKWLANAAFGVFVAVVFVAYLSVSLHQEAGGERKEIPDIPYKVESPHGASNGERKVFVSKKRIKESPVPFIGMKKDSPVKIYRGDDERNRQWNETWEKLLNNQKSLSDGDSQAMEIRP
jgi:hypothetical protein